MDFQPSFNDKLPLLLQTLFFKFIFVYQRMRHGEAMREVHSLAGSLERHIFPDLVKMHYKWVTLTTPADERLIVDKHDGTSPINIPGTACLASLLTKFNIKTIRLDTRLESNQICEAFMVLLHAAPSFSSAHSEYSPAFAYNTRNLKTMLLGPDGLHQFCALMHYKLKSGCFEVEYSYCLLYYTHALNKLLTHHTKTQNHRAIFSLGPKVGIAFGLIAFVVVISAAGASEFAIALGVILSLFFGTTIGYLFNTIASIIYDREHSDLILQENMQEIKTLSHFPINNPHPIIKVGASGDILYSNPATARLLEKMSLQTEHLPKILPDDYKNITTKCKENCKESNGLEVNRHGRTIRYEISHFPEDNTMMFAGTDVTKLKRLELELLEFNRNLAKKVREKTKELQITQDVTILSLASLVETRDPETGEHINRTRLYVQILAQKLRKHPKYIAELDNDDVITLLYHSAPLHDIGKVGIVDAILLKPGKLTPEEFEEMKKHTTIGGDSLRWAEKRLGSSSFLRYAREIAYTHHEKWDGTGYPEGLVGEAIPISGRLMALADVYDALTSKRVYKEAFSTEKSKKIIMEGKGKHFDPDIVEAFLAEESRFLEIAAKYRDP